MNYAEHNTPDLTSEEIRLINEAGASDVFIDVVTFDIDEVDATRNSALIEVKKYFREWGVDNVEELKDDRKLGGHFFTALWEGDLYDAFCRADGNNSAILKTLFSQERINRERPAHRSPVTV